MLDRYIRIGIIATILLIGAVFLMNQTQNYIYRAHLLQTPCDLCLKANPNLTMCKKQNIIIEPNYTKIDLSKYKLDG